MLLSQEEVIGLGSRLDTLESRVEALEASLEALKARLEALKAQFSGFVLGFKDKACHDCHNGSLETRLIPLSPNSELLITQHALEGLGFKAGDRVRITRLDPEQGAGQDTRKEGGEYEGQREPLNLRETKAGETHPRPPGGSV